MPEWLRTHDDKTTPAPPAVATTARATTRLVLDDGERQLLGVLPPALLLALADQRASVLLADGTTAVALRRQAGHVRIGELLVRPDAYEETANAYHASRAANVGSGGRVLVTVPQQHRLRRAMFERR
jgi:hypothetical protein